MKNCEGSSEVSQENLNAFFKILLEWQEKESLLSTEVENNATHLSSTEKTNVGLSHNTGEQI